MEHQELVRRLAGRLIEVSGIRAVVLGGSRARGTHRPDSDMDLGLYYDGTPDLEALTGIARSLPGNEQVVVAGPGGWGPWVDGGAWLRIDGLHVDWILRDVHRVQEQCARALAGEFSFHAQPGHPLGFLDIAYAAEIATCQVLEDPDGFVAGAKEVLQPYPPALRGVMVANLWQAEFLLAGARKVVDAGDPAYVHLCCSTALMLCAHGWHAAAGVWVTNEKGLVPGVERLALDTGGFSAAARRALEGSATAGERVRLEAVEELVRSTVAALAGTS